MKKGIQFLYFAVAIVVTCFISMFLFSVFNFNYKVFDAEAFSPLYAFIKIAVYLVVFKLVYKQVAFLFDRLLKGIDKELSGVN